MKIAIIIPCYNEAGSIGTFLQHLHRVREQHQWALTPVVVNDCSTDHTLEIVRALDCVVLDLPVNLGIGGAVQTGFRYAWQQGYDLAIQMDGDGQHPADELPKILEPFRRGEADVVIGSRFLEKQGFQSSSLRRLGIRWFSWLLQRLCGQRISDPTSGFRAMNRRAIELIKEFYPNEYPEPEILVHFLHRRLRVQEVPVRMEARQAGQSSIHSWKTAYYMLKVSFAICFSHIRLQFYGKR
jgi:glycosyltransferase involved in cell wall biosynthesis